MLSASVIYAIFLFGFLEKSVSAIHCYSYRTQKNDFTGIRARMINCDQEFNIRSQACLRTEYINSHGKQKVLGFCGDICPPILRGRERCIYQDGTANFEVIHQISGMPNAVAVCCCDTDFCNSSIRTVFSGTLILLSLLVFLFVCLFYQ